MLYTFSDREIANALYTVFSMYEHDEHVYMETSLGTFSRRVEDDTEYEMDVALQVYDNVNDFILFGWHVVE
jgi:hypothetical protein